MPCLACYLVITPTIPYQALARVVMFKAMPSDALLLECKAQSAAQFFKQVRSLVTTPIPSEGLLECKAQAAAQFFQAGAFPSYHP